MILSIKHPKQKDGKERKISERRGEKRREREMGRSREEQHRLETKDN